MPNFKSTRWVKSTKSEKSFSISSTGQMVKGLFFQICVLQPVDHHLQCNLPTFKMSHQKPVKTIQRPSNRIYFNLTAKQLVSSIHLSENYIKVTVLVQNIVVLHIVCKFPSRLSASLSYWSRLSFSSSRWCYQRSNAKFGVPNGLDQPFATKLPAATAHSEICERKTRMDFRFAHLCKITAISKGNKHPDFLHQVSETILYSPILNFATNNIALVQNVCQNLLDVQLFSMLTNFFQFCGLLNVHHRHIDSCREI